MRLSQAIPAMPVADIPAATHFYFYEQRLAFTIAREFATLDLDGNLLTFFRRLSSRTSPGANP